ncbi:MAG: hypothetical protein NT010_02705 [Proteobacteria bacterium]|nr:hypothetical protein [Pseudomonadota bacterium]
MRTQIRALNETTEIKIGGNGNGHMAHIQNIDYLADFYSRLGQKAIHTEVALPEKTKRSDGSNEVFVRSPWITSGVLTVNMLGYRQVAAPKVFVRSPWIKTGALKVNMPLYKTAKAPRIFVKSSWITSGALTVNIPLYKTVAAPNSRARKGGFNRSNAVFVRSPWIISFGIFPAARMDHSIENCLRLVAVLTSVNQDRTPLAYLKAA